jgi:hypothetical protein
MFLLYHSDRCNTSETVFHWCYVNDLHTTHAVVCWVTTTVVIFIIYSYIWGINLYIQRPSWRSGEIPTTAVLDELVGLLGR